MLSKTRVRQLLAIFIVVVTISLFASFFINNPSVIDQLQNIPSGTVALLLGLYLVFTFSISLIISATVSICRARISRSESFLLTSYSAVINFFGPLQSGPAFRAVYLKQKHGVSIKNYTVASLGYYLIYGVISLLLLFSGVLDAYIAPILVVALAAAGYIFYKKEHLKSLGLFNPAWLKLLLATILQIFLLVIIFGIELKAIDSNIGLDQILIYTGAANLALFVSITPGAIGFREAFLIFSQNLHGIDTSVIVAASTIDRGVYVVMLVFLSVLIAATHSGKRFKIIGQGNSSAKASAKE